MAFIFLLFILCIIHPQPNALARVNKFENELSYMAVVSDAGDLPPVSEYDYIVIGGGTAGCPLAATLSQQNHSVLVLERGGVPLSYPNILKSDQFGASLAQDDDGRNPVERFTSLDGVENARGRVLGGSSMINAGFYSRAERDFYLKSGINWDFHLVAEAYEWVEEAIVYRSGLLQWQATVREALLEAGVGPDNGFTLEHLVGAKQSGSTFDASGRKHGAVELLSRGDFRNLRVAVRATVDRILFADRVSEFAAVGVAYRDSYGRPHHAFIRGSGEVILSAGTLGSPQLLLLSGVGPTSDLSSKLIPVLKPHPHVGKFVADNPRNNIAFVIPSSSIDDSYLQVVGIGPDFYIESSSSTTTFQPVGGPSSLLGNLTSSVNLTIGLLAAKVPGPASYGSISLASPVDVRVAPNVRFNYFSDPVDLARCVKGVSKMGDMLRTNALARFKFNQGSAGEAGFKYFGPSFPRNYRSDKNYTSLENFCKRTITTWWHYHGGCVAGKVVDGDFRVMGINSLRVVDGSVLNRSPGTNPQATLMMMGRYAGLKILHQRT